MNFVLKRVHLPLDFDLRYLMHLNSDFNKLETKFSTIHNCWLEERTPDPIQRLRSFVEFGGGARNIHFTFTFCEGEQLFVGRPMDFVLSREWSVSWVGTYTHLHSLAAGLTPQALDLFAGSLAPQAHGGPAIRGLARLGYANLVYYLAPALTGSFFPSKGHFTHEPRAVTMRLWEPKRKCPKAVPTHLQNHVVWSQILKCSVKSYVNGPSTKCYFNAFLFTRVLTHDKIE